MNIEIEPIYIGQEDDIDVGSVENFEHEEIDYAIFHLESGFFATQGHCNCEDNAFISEGSVEDDKPFLSFVLLLPSVQSMLKSCTFLIGFL